ncbi:LPS assembly lipoprotein LptE [Pelomonas sp. SE-A7]|uniref:LPS-assembly lipoprotein LptE n=1 Tax=Pelomonas sp. SE-A7 TaxID=3054953 RepID=UPI00259D29D7|nr:LPS assembly lipoprotein LptE [Pelomonas sp. SE-A7]MDM4766960.1 LPS assembly lipoprotein LptE [Pelomonas sp. SE-A7]
MLAGRRRLVLALPATLMVACGFELRRDSELKIQRIALVGFQGDSPMLAELRRQIGRSQARIVEDLQQAELILESRFDRRDKTVVASTSAGQVREWQLRLRFDFLLRTPGGELLLPRTELRLTREMNYTETAALAKEQEEAALYRAMQSDAVAQVMRHLAAVKLPS